MTALQQGLVAVHEESREPGRVGPTTWLPYRMSPSR